MYLISSQHVVLPATRLLNWDLRFSWLYFCCVPVGDAPSGHSGQKFSTFNKDQDAVEGGNCARSHLGAFWYNSCFNTNPNGVYRWGGWWNSLCCWSGVGPVEGLGLLPEEHQHEGPSCAEDLQDRVTAEYHHQSESVSVRAADSLLLQMFPSVCCCN